MLSLWLSLSSWKISLIKVQTVATSPLLKWPKSFLYYVANSTMSLRQVHNTQSFLPPCCLPVSNPYEQNSSNRHSWQNRASSPHSHSLCYFLPLSLVPRAWAAHVDRDCFSPHSAYSWTAALSGNRIKPNSEHTGVGTLPIFTYQNAELSADPRHRTPMSLCPVSQRSHERQWCSEHPAQPGSPYLGSWHSQTGAGSRLLRGK